MTSTLALRCRECGRDFEPTLRYVCEECFGPLDVVYEYGDLRFDKDVICLRSKTFWRYEELLPIKNRSSVVDLGAGFTPLHRCERLGEVFGLKNLYVKNDAVNPTFSFKDRPAGVGVSKAVEFGLSAVGCASTGNLAAATAAYAARKGLTCYVFMPKGLETSKIAQILAYGPRVIEVEGTYDDANRIASLAAEEYHIGVVNVNLRPYYVEGSKTLAFEVAEQLEWTLPDHIIIPVGSGALLHSVCKGFEELVQVGCIDEVTTKVTAAQPCGCAPVVKGFKTGASEIVPVDIPETSAQSLAIGDPGDGFYALKKVRQYHGFAEDPTDNEVIEAIRLLASKEGIFTEPAGGVSVAALKRLAEEGLVDKHETVVCCVTGNGLKTPDLILSVSKHPVSIKPELRLVTPLIGSG